MKNKCKRIAVFPTNHTHKTLVSLNNQTFYGTDSLTKMHTQTHNLNLSVLENQHKVRRSVNPTNRIIAKRARDSSGPISLQNTYANT